MLESFASSRSSEPIWASDSELTNDRGIFAFICPTGYALDPLIRLWTDGDRWITGIMFDSQTSLLMINQCCYYTSNLCPWALTAVRLHHNPCRDLILSSDNTVSDLPLLTTSSLSLMLCRLVPHTFKGPWVWHMRVVIRYSCKIEHSNLDSIYSVPSKVPSLSVNIFSSGIACECHRSYYP